MGAASNRELAGLGEQFVVDNDYVNEAGKIVERKMLFDVQDSNSFKIMSDLKGGKNSFKKLKLNGKYLTWLEKFHTKDKAFKENLRDLVHKSVDALPERYGPVWGEEGQDENAYYVSCDALKKLPSKRSEGWCQTKMDVDKWLGDQTGQVAGQAKKTLQNPKATKEEIKKAKEQMQVVQKMKAVETDEELIIPVMPPSEPEPESGPQPEQQEEKTPDPKPSTEIADDLSESVGTPPAPTPKAPVQEEEKDNSPVSPPAKAKSVKKTPKRKPVSGGPANMEIMEQINAHKDFGGNWSLSKKLMVDNDWTNISGLFQSKVKGKRPTKSPTSIQERIWEQGIHYLYLCNRFVKGKEEKKLFVATLFPNKEGKRQGDLVCLSQKGKKNDPNRKFLLLNNKRMILRPVHTFRYSAKGEKILLDCERGVQLVSYKPQGSPCKTKSTTVGRKSVELYGEHPKLGRYLKQLGEATRLMLLGGSEDVVRGVLEKIFRDMRRR